MIRSSALVLFFLWTNPVWADAELAKKHGCMACHAVEKRSVGPAFRDIAKKYQSKDMAQISQNIRAGGSGRWGAVPMPPHPQVSPREAESLARWILETK